MAPKLREHGQVPCADAESALGTETNRTDAGEVFRPIRPLGHHPFVLVRLGGPGSTDLAIEDGEVVDLIELLHPIPRIQPIRGEQQLFHQQVEALARGRFHDRGEDAEVEVGVLEPRPRCCASPHVARVVRAAWRENVRQGWDVGQVGVALGEEISVARPVPNPRGVGEQMIHRQGDVRMTGVGRGTVHVVGQGGVVGEGAGFDQLGDGQCDHGFADGGHAKGGLTGHGQVALDVPKTDVRVHLDVTLASRHDTKAGQFMRVDQFRPVVGLGNGRQDKSWNQSEKNKESAHGVRQT